MNMTMQQSPSYPFYMGRLSFPLATGQWPSTPLYMPTGHPQQFPASYSNARALSPLVLSQQPNVYPSLKRLSSPYPNIRYPQLKQSTLDYPTRRSMRRKRDSFKTLRRSQTYNAPVYDQYYGSSIPKSTSYVEPLPSYSSTHLSKSQSWHTSNHRRSNLSVAYAQEIHLTPRRPRKRSPKKKRKQHHSYSPKRKPSLVPRRKRPAPIPPCGVVRISTLDEMPIAMNQTNNKRVNSINNDRSSMKGSVSKSTKSTHVSKDRSSKKKATQTRKTTTNEENHVTRGTQSLRSASSSSLSSLPSLSSSNHSSSSFQRRLNNSLRSDPFITAAMQTFQQLRQGSSQNISVTPRARSPSLDSLHSDTTIRSVSLARSHSQSSFTSIERSEIRELIKTAKTKGAQALDTSAIPLNSIPVVISSSETVPESVSQLTTSSAKPKKSCITEELDREFDKLRALDPNQEITNVIPSTMCKRKKILTKPFQSTPLPPKFDELLRQVQLRPVTNVTKPVPKVKQTPIEDNYENPLSSVPVPRSSPIPSHHHYSVANSQDSHATSISPISELKTEEHSKYEYATPIKKAETIRFPFAHVSRFQPMRKLSFSRPMSKFFTHKQTPHPVVASSWPQCDLPDQLPSTFQPKSPVNCSDEPVKAISNENIYATDADIVNPSSDKIDDNPVDFYLDNQTIMTDELYIDEGITAAIDSKVSISLFDDFSNLFMRKNKHEIKLNKRNQRCSIM